MEQEVEELEMQFEIERQAGVNRIKEKYIERF